MVKRLYISLIELRPRPGCPHCPPEVAGAAVRCYVAATSHDEATSRIDDACQSNGFDVVNVEWCVDKDEVEWEHPNDADGDECVSLAYSTGEVVFGELYTWPHGSEDV